MSDLSTEERIDRLEGAVMKLVESVNRVVHVRDVAGGPLASLAAEREEAERLDASRLLEERRAVEAELAARRNAAEGVVVGGSR